jgi:hypothetical protein
VGGAAVGVLLHGAQLMDSTFVLSRASRERPSISGYR